MVASKNYHNWSLQGFWSLNILGPKFIIKICIHNHTLTYIFIKQITQFLTGQRVSTKITKS